MSHEAIQQQKNAFAECRSRIEEQYRKAIAAVEVNERQLQLKIENEQEF